MQLEGIPDGFEAVRFGKVKAGESFINLEGAIDTASGDLISPRLIVAPRPPAVKWAHGVFNNGWIAQDSEVGGRRIFWFDKRPQQDNGKWEPVDTTCCCEIDPDCISKSAIQFRDDLPWTARIIQVGPSVEK